MATGYKRNWLEQSEPDDWADIVDLCAVLSADLPQLVKETVEAVRRELPDYRIVGRAEHELGVRQQYENFLTGLATRRLPSVEENEKARALGRQRARDGLPLQALMGAYQVGYRQMWNTLLARADARDERLSAQLVRVVDMVWMWAQQASSAAADAYVEAIRAEDAAQLTLTYRFLEALYEPAPPTVALVRLARALAFDPAGQFQAVCAPAEAWPNDRLADLRVRLGRRRREWREKVRCANRGTVMVAVVQNTPVNVVIEAMRHHDRGMPIGIGLVRAGLSGAAASIVDAEEVLPLAIRGQRAVSFEEKWLLATLGPRAARLAPLLEHCREPAKAHPEVTDTVYAFAANNLSFTATGRAMHLHANTVKYRLERWRQLTGWDVRTWDGLSASMLGLGLFADQVPDQGSQHREMSGSPESAH